MTRKAIGFVWAPSKPTACQLTRQRQQKHLFSFHSATIYELRLGTQKISPPGSQHPPLLSGRSWSRVAILEWLIFMHTLLALIQEYVVREQLIKIMTEATSPSK
jgi:hypothetical protein